MSSPEDELLQVPDHKVVAAPLYHHAALHLVLQHDLPPLLVLVVVADLVLLDQHLLRGRPQHQPHAALNRHRLVRPLLPPLHPNLEVLPQKLRKLAADQRSQLLPSLLLVLSQQLALDLPASESLRPVVPEDELEEPHQLVLDRLAPFDEFVSLGLGDDGGHLRPALECLVDPHRQQVDQRHELFPLLRLAWNIYFRKRLELNVEHLSLLGQLRRLLLGLFHDVLGRLVFIFLSEQAADALFLLGIFDGNYVLVDHLFFSPRSIIFNQLGML